MKIVAAVGVALAVAVPVVAQSDVTANYVAGQLIELNDNGAWSWFMDERAIVQHRELYRGTTRDAGKTWTWEPITANSTADNLRPLVPKWKDARTALVWMRGAYRHNHGEWTTAVVATILPPRAP
jgi:anaerobic selenocysteine-containing dehydrogenase